MPDIKINAMDASKLYNFFQYEAKQGVRSWDVGKYKYGDDSVILEARVIAFESKKEDTRLRYGIIGKYVAGGGFSNVYEIDYTLAPTRRGARLKPRGVDNKTRLVKAINPDRSSERRVKNEYFISPPYLHMKRPVFFNSDIFLVMRKIEGDELWSILNIDNNLTIKERFEISIATITELMAIHDTCKLHRDIKPENIMVNRKTRPLSVRFIDFGLSMDEVYPDTDVVGSLGFVAPEMLDPTIGPQRSTIDVFSLGRTLALLWGIKLNTYKQDGSINVHCRNIFDYKDDDFFRDFEFEDDNAKMMIRLVLRGMLHPDPANRMSLGMALSCFKEAGKDYLDPPAPLSPPVPTPATRPNWFHRKWQKLSHWMRGKRSTASIEAPDEPQYNVNRSTSIALDSLSIVHETADEVMPQYIAVSVGDSEDDSYYSNRTCQLRDNQPHDNFSTPSQPRPGF